MMLAFKESHSLAMHYCRLVWDVRSLSEVLFAGGENPLPEEDDTIEMLFSRKAVTDSLLSRLIPKKKPEADKHMVPVIDLEKRLSLLAH